MSKRKPLITHIGPHRIEDVCLLVETFPWWKRLIAWWFWKTPLKYMMRRAFVNPYGHIVAKVNVAKWTRHVVKGDGNERDE